MFRRVARRLTNIINEMDHRPDHVDVFLPFEFSPQGQSERGISSVECAQMSMQAGKARKFLKALREKADSQSLRFSMSLLLMLLFCFAHAAFSMFVTVVLLYTIENHECGKCDDCQNLSQLMFVWYNQNPEFFPLFASICSAPPLMFAIKLMTTNRDLLLMLDPHNFRSDAVDKQLLRPSSEQKIQDMLNQEAVRMGIELK
jgi:hypothetical protein